MHLPVVRFKGRLEAIGSRIRRLLTMPEVRHGLRLAGWILAAVLIVQLVYPRGRALPFSSLGGTRVNFARAATVRQNIEAQEQQTFVVQAGEARLETSFAALGTDLDEQAAAARVVDYPLAKRLLPFSILWPHRVPAIPLKHNPEKLEAFARKIADQANRQPQDAVISKRGEEYQVTESRAGVIFEAAKTMEALQRLQTVPADGMQLAGQPEEPVFSTEDFNQMIAEREQLLARPLRLSVADYNQPVARAVLAGWTDVAANPASRKVELTYNRPLMTQYLRSISNQVGTAPTPTTIRLVDGREVGRTMGREGRAVPGKPSIEAIIKALETGAPEVPLELQTVAAPVVYERSYTRSGAGLQLLLEEWQRDNGGATVAVAVRSLSGPPLAANLNADKPFFAASMYKLYLAQYVLSAFERGTMDPNAPVSTTGKNTSQCVEAMIVQSDNACPQALIAQISSRTLNSFVRAEGFSGTVFLSDGTNGTAKDTAVYLERLHGGRLLGTASTELLLGYMGRQIYRSAIPAGSAPAGVADKVGFYGSVWHDGGIVYHARGAYVLVAYTENASAAAIKDLAQRVNDFMSR